VEADFTRVAARRSDERDAMRRRGVNLTYLAFVALATVEALQRHPRLNASVREDEIVYHEEVNLGIAVALDDGLVVPVIRQAQRLSLEGMAAGIAGWSRMRSTAAPSRSPTRVGSGRFSPPRSSTSPRWRSWTWRRWSSGPLSSRAQRAI
jgi:hypothetical protein